MDDEPDGHDLAEKLLAASGLCENRGKVIISVKK